MLNSEGDAQDTDFSRLGMDRISSQKPCPNTDLRCRVRCRYCGRTGLLLHHSTAAVGRAVNLALNLAQVHDQLDET